MTSIIRTPTKLAIHTAMAKVGGAKGLSQLLYDRCGVSIKPRTIHIWSSKGFVPANFVKAVSIVTDIPVADLNPKFEERL